MRESDTGYYIKRGRDVGPWFPARQAAIAEMDARNREQERQRADLIRRLRDEQADQQASHRMGTGYRAKLLGEAADALEQSNPSQWFVTESAE